MKFIRAALLPIALLVFAPALAASAVPLRDKASPASNSQDHFDLVNVGEYVRLLVPRDWKRIDPSGREENGRFARDRTGDRVPTYVNGLAAESEGQGVILQVSSAAGNGESQSDLIAAVKSRPAEVLDVFQGHALASIERFNRAGASMGLRAWGAKASFEMVGGKLAAVTRSKRSALSGGNVYLVTQYLFLMGEKQVVVSIHCRDGETARREVEIRRIVESIEFVPG